MTRYSRLADSNRLISILRKIGVSYFTVKAASLALPYRFGLQIPWDPPHTSGKTRLVRDPNMSSHSEIKAICTLLEAFVSGTDRSLRIANEIEVALDKAFPTDEEISDYVSDFALFRPGGGDYLYDEAQLVPMCVALLDILLRRMSGS